MDPASRRPAWVTAAGIILIVTASLVALPVVFTIVAALAGDAGAAIPAFVAGTWTAAHFAAGIGAMSRRGWARTLGIVLSAIGAALAIMVLALMVFAAATLPEALSDPALVEEGENDSRFAELFGTETAHALAGQLAVLWILASALFLTPLVAAYLCALFGLVRERAYFAWRPPPPYGGWPGPPPPGWPMPPPRAGP